MARSPAQRFQHIVDDRLLESLRTSTVDATDASYFPPELYTSEDWFQFEKEAVYARSWLAVGRADFLKQPGDYYTVTINDDPLIVVMGDDGAIRVLSAVCQHRGHLLVEDAGTLERGLFRCPLHYWSYDTRGQLVHTPEMQKTNDFDKSLYCLPELKVEVWQGFVFAHFDADAPALAPTLWQLEQEMKNYGVADMVSLPTIDVPGYPWNWKVMLENFMEPYHNTYLHRGIHDFALGHGFCEHGPDENVIMHPTGMDRRDGAFNPLHKALLPPIETLTDEQRQRVMFAMIPPMMPLGLVSDHMFYFLVLPNGANEISLRIGLCVPPDSLRVRNFEKIVGWIVDGIMMYNEQDVEADTSVQRGLRSRFAPRGRMSWKETTVAQLNRWLYQRYEQYAHDAGLARANGSTA